jgi:selenocysteine lyase/cysteine desulfurase
MLSDRYGIQARGGCACAGPYAHRLLGIDEVRSEEIRESLSAREELEKPGWVRLNLSYLLTDAKAREIVDGVDRLSREASDLAGLYRAEAATARFTPHQEPELVGA